MIKRLKYISRETRPMGATELAEIAAASQRNNAKIEVTGVLVKVGEFYFQVLEGPADAVDATFIRIEADERHRDIVMVGKPERVEQRLFGTWAMRTEALQPKTVARHEPLGAIFDSIVELRQKSDDLASVLQRAVLIELRRVDAGLNV
jgi:hypothetical protein